MTVCSAESSRPSVWSLQGPWELRQGVQVSLGLLFNDTPHIIVKPAAVTLLWYG